MAYMLRKDHKNGRIYLKLYYSFRDPVKKGPRSQYVRTLGFVDALQADGLEDPIARFQKVVDQMNDDLQDDIQSSKAEQIGAVSLVRHFGYFPLQTLLRKLDVQEEIDRLAAGQRFSQPVYDCLCALIYANAVYCEDCGQTLSHRIAGLLGPFDFSEEEILSCLEFVGSHYPTIIEIFTRHLAGAFGIDTSATYLAQGPCVPAYIRTPSPSSAGELSAPVLKNALDLCLLFDAHTLPIGMRITDAAESSSFSTLIPEFLTEYRVRIKKSTKANPDNPLYKKYLADGIVDECFRLHAAHSIRRNNKQYEKAREMFDRTEDAILCLQPNPPAIDSLSARRQLYGRVVVGYLRILLERLFQWAVLKDEFDWESTTAFFCGFLLAPQQQKKGYDNLSTSTPLLEFIAQNWSLPLLCLSLRKSQIKKIASAPLSLYPKEAPAN